MAKFYELNPTQIYNVCDPADGGDWLVEGWQGCDIMWGAKSDWPTGAQAWRWRDCQTPDYEDAGQETIDGDDDEKKPVEIAR